MNAVVVLLARAGGAVFQIHVKFLDLPNLFSGDVSKHWLTAQCLQELFHAEVTHS